jgi:hypothetical protein
MKKLTLFIAFLAICMLSDAAGAQSINGSQIRPGVVLRKSLSVAPELGTPTPNDIRFRVRSNPRQTPVPVDVFTVDAEGDFTANDADVLGDLSVGGTATIDTVTVIMSISAPSGQFTNVLAGLMGVAGTASINILSVTGNTTIEGDLDLNGAFLHPSQSLFIDGLGGDDGVQKVWPLDNSPAYRTDATLPASMQIVVLPGTGRVSGVAVELVESATLTIVAPVGSDRIDIVQVGTDGVPEIKQGTPAGSPAAPTKDENHMLIAEIYVSDGATQIHLSNINSTKREYL